MRGPQPGARERVPATHGRKFTSSHCFKLNFKQAFLNKGMISFCCIAARAGDDSAPRGAQAVALVRAQQVRQDQRLPLHLRPAQSHSTGSNGQFVFVSIVFFYF